MKKKIDINFTSDYDRVWKIINKGYVWDEDLADEIVELIRAIRKETMNSKKNKNVKK